LSFSDAALSLQFGNRLVEFRVEILFRNFQAVFLQRYAS
jgi:hypothetical protein